MSRRRQPDDLYVQLTRAQKRQRKRAQRVADSKPSRAELRERFAARYAGGWPSGPLSVRSR
jgi:hypothetical protein